VKTKKVELAFFYCLCHKPLRCEIELLRACLCCYTSGKTDKAAGVCPRYSCLVPNCGSLVIAQPVSRPSARALYFRHRHFKHVGQKLPFDD